MGKLNLKLEKSWQLEFSSTVFPARVTLWNALPGTSSGTTCIELLGEKVKHKMKLSVCFFGMIKVIILLMCVLTHKLDKLVGFGSSISGFIVFHVYMHLTLEL